jgi:geranylgeranyl diphosphate synthase, type III
MDHNTLDISHILEPFTYMSNLPGKGLRKVFINAFEEWIEISKDKCNIINDIIAMLHNASLMYSWTK